MNIVSDTAFFSPKRFYYRGSYLCYHSMFIDEDFNLWISSLIIALFSLSSIAGFLGSTGGLEAGGVVCLIFSLFFLPILPFLFNFVFRSLPNLLKSVSIAPLYMWRSLKGVSWALPKVWERWVLCKTLDLKDVYDLVMDFEWWTYSTFTISIVSDKFLVVTVGWIIYRLSHMGLS